MVDDRFLDGVTSIETIAKYETKLPTQYEMILQSVKDCFVGNLDDVCWSNTINKTLDALIPFFR